MEFLNSIPTKKLAIIVGVVTGVAWILKPGVVAVVISIVGGGLVALRSMSGPGSADAD
jgi:hypothetical protein